MRNNSISLLLLSSALYAGLPHAALAQISIDELTDSGQTEYQADLEKDSDEDVIIAYGRQIDLVGDARSASEGVVGFADFELRPLSRPGELVEVIPGMVATQHSGGGKANQYFLRGFNLDHGTDFAVSIDNVGLNLRSHPHMNGYLDINFMIPETIERVDYSKGTHNVQNGDFSIAGAAAFKTKDEFEQGFAELQLSDYGFVRTLIADSYALSDDRTLLYAGEYQSSEGPFDLSEDLTKFNGYLKYAQPLGAGRLTSSLFGYASEWKATDQIPLRAVEDGTISRFGYLDPSLGGETQRFIATSTYEQDDFRVTAYASRNELDLYGNPTFFLDQDNGDAFVQVDRRWSYGVNADYKKDKQLGDYPVELVIGGGVNVEDIGESGLYLTTDRVKREAIRDDEITEITSSVYGQATVNWTDKLRTTLGLRGDHYAYDVDGLIAENAGDGSDAVLNPKFALGYSARDDFELYAAYGTSFHSNDVSGAVQTIDPNTGEPSDRVDLLVKGQGGEIGVRFHPSHHFNISAALYQLELDSELIFVGDAGTSEPSDATHRQGFELSSFWKPNDILAFDGSATWSDAKFADSPQGEDRIPNSVEFTASAGVTAVFDNGINSSLRLRHLGESALIEDNSQRSESTTLVNLGVTKEFENFSLGFDVLNLFDAEDNDITFYYESQLSGESAPVEDIHFHPVYPREIKLILRVNL